MTLLIETPSIKTTFKSASGVDITLFAHHVGDGKIKFYNVYGVEFAEVHKFQQILNFIKDLRTRDTVKRMLMHFISPGQHLLVHCCDEIESPIEPMTLDDLITCGLLPKP